MNDAAPPASADAILRAITDDAAFRVVTVRTTATVRGAVEAQRRLGTLAKSAESEALTRTFGELLTATILVRETMAPDNRVQGILAGGGKSRMVADAHPDGATRGIVQMAPGARDMRLESGASLQMMRTLFSGQIHQGIVAVPPSGSVSGALMQYMQDSEQVVSVIAVGCRVKGGEVIEAGGYIVQLLPEVKEAPLAVMTERLRDFATMDPLFDGGHAAPAAMMNELLYAMPYTVVGDGAVRFGCQCSQARLAASLATLPRHEIESMIDDGKVLEITCDYCGRDYRIAPEQLRGLLASN